MAKRWRGRLNRTAPVRHRRPGRLKTVRLRKGLARGKVAVARRNGFRLGWEQGYHLGRCRAVAGSVAVPLAVPKYPIRLMYITSGLGMPYAPLDQVIADNLREQVEELMVTTPYEDVVRIASEFRPAAAMTLDGVQLFSEEKSDGLRNLGVKTAAWFVDDPYYADLTTTMAFHYDYVFTIELSCFELYRNMGHANAHYMPLAVQPDFFQPVQVGPQYLSDICFIGTAFWNRVNFFDQLIPHLGNRKLRIIGLWWDRMQHYEMLKHNISLNHWLPPAETAKYYNGAKIVVNLHRSSDDLTYNRNSNNIPALSINPRTFEITASGAFQLSDVRQDMQRFLEPGKEIETFANLEEFISKMNYYLDNSEARQTVALSGLRRTLQEHTFRKRLSDMLRVIMES